MENNLRKGAAKKGYQGKRADRYVYGTMQKRGKLKKKKAKSREVQAQAVEGY